MFKDVELKLKKSLKVGGKMRYVLFFYKVFNTGVDLPILILFNFAGGMYRLAGKAFI